MVKAKYNLPEVVRAYKEKRGEEENMLKIIDCMQLLIGKYVRQAYWGEKEDVRQELVLAVIEAVGKMESYDSEGGCVAFLGNAIRNRFFELYRKHRVVQAEESVEMEAFDYIEGRDKYGYCNAEFQVDLEQMLHLNSATQRRIARYILCEQKTDSEIARCLKFSRQYVNRCKKEIFKKILEYSKSD